MDSPAQGQVSGKQAKSERIRLGLNRARAEGKQIGRPRVILPSQLVVELRQAGYSWAEIARRLGAGTGTVRRAFDAATSASQPCQNPISEAT